MGQYYKFVNISKKQKCDLHQVPMKLTEHSYVGNIYCNDALNLLMDEWSGDEVIHLCDYAEGKDGTNTQQYISKIKKEYGLSTTAYEWSGTFKDTEPSNEYKVRYIYNLDKKEYIDLLRQPIDWISIYEDKVYFNKFNSFALLTACGNGLGGGDYYSLNKEYIGSWAGNHFVASEKKLDKYSDFDLNDIVFSEELVSRKHCKKYVYDDFTYEDYKHLLRKICSIDLENVIEKYNLKDLEIKKLKIVDDNLLEEEKSEFNRALDKIKLRYEVSR